jgi:UDP-N-acetylglucosamine 2-epimerase (non-hydrolysing)
LVLTDSGGLQEEAPILGKPVLVLRNRTDRPESIASGSALLVTTDRDSIVRSAARILDSRRDYDGAASRPSPYGDGRAAERIVQGILSYFGRAAPPEPFE